jgi:hypothetical protein
MIHRTPVSPSSTQETASVPEFAGLWAQEAAGVEGGRRLKLTKLEVKMMEEARKKQKENIVQPQVTIVSVVVVVVVVVLCMHITTTNPCPPLGGVGSHVQGRCLHQRPPLHRNQRL